jgi:N-methylhydantoinase A
MMRIGIDTGGTFTDFVVLHEDGRIESFKLRSNPRAPHEVILAGLARAAAGAETEIVHGSTVATNALLERKGARTAFITTAGFEDLLEIGRQNRAALYDLTPGPKRLLVPPALCFGVEERILADGSIEAAPHKIPVQRLAKRLREEGVESVAICLLHSYRQPASEQAVAGLLRQVGFLSVSSEVCPEFREYERACTTALNAYVGPVMQRYLQELESSCGGRIWIMQSNGGALTIGEATRQAVRTILSGPAGGVTGALETAKRSGFSRIIGFDMGGTSTDVCLCDGTPRETHEAYVDGLPVRVPMLEIHTVGAGGGSLARLDEGGILRVGPESAGADPGPACYGTGAQPTVTDAHAVLGRIAAHQLAGGSLPIQLERAAKALQVIASQTGLSLEEAASGVIRIANAAMTRAIRLVSVEKGFDPRDFALVAFGGCGGLHACEIAEELGVQTVVAPPFAGSLSALGMLLADRMRDAAQGVPGEAGIEEAFQRLEQQLRGSIPGAIELSRSADLRYRGQSYELTVPWRGDATADLFAREHARIYGYSHHGREMEVVTVRVRARQGVSKPHWMAGAPSGGPPVESRRVYAAGQWMKMPVWLRDDAPTQETDGPALICDYGATTLIPPKWRFFRDSAGSLVLRRAPEAGPEGSR